MLSLQRRGQTGERDCSATRRGLARAAAMRANWLIHDRVRLDATYTYTDAKDLRTDLRLLRRPEHEAWVGVSTCPYWQPVVGPASA
jgi:hypothetical protein